MEKFKGKYRIHSARLQNWDYGWNGAYFVTICTQDRKHYFGEIINGKMRLSKIGESAEKCWIEIPKHFPFVKLDEFVVMPNHIHGIIEIAKLNNEHNHVHNDGHDVETQNFASLPTSQTMPTPTKSKNKFGPQSQNLASIIRGYKIGVTKSAKIINENWAWQPRYYDHIIRNEKSYNIIKNYIINNPLKWAEDEFNVQTKDITA